MGNYDVTVDYIRGRLHLPEITNAYKKRTDLSTEEETPIKQALKSTADQAAQEKKMTRKAMKEIDEINRNPIKINSNHVIQQYQSTRNCMSAIAAVDYAMRDTKPTCGLA